MIEIEWDANADEHSRRRHPYRHKASTIHGWVTKLRGTLFGDESVRRRGIREMKDARTIRRYKRARSAEEKRKNGHSRGLFSFFTSSRALKKRRPSQRIVVSHERSRSTRRTRGKEPLLHFPSRTKPPYHGHGTRIAGIVTHNKSKVEKGKSMNRSAARERARERRRRAKQKRREAIEMKKEARGIRPSQW